MPRPVRGFYLLCTAGTAVLFLIIAGMWIAGAAGVFSEIHPRLEPDSLPAAFAPFIHPAA